MRLLFDFMTHKSKSSDEQMLVKGIKDMRHVYLTTVGAQKDMGKHVSFAVLLGFARMLTPLRFVVYSDASVSSDVRLHHLGEAYKMFVCMQPYLGCVWILQHYPELYVRMKC